MDTFAERLRAAIGAAKERADDPVYQAKAEELRLSWEAFEARSKELERADHLRRCGVPPSAARLLDATEITQALTAVTAFGKNDAKFLLLVGEKGVGKTVAAWHAVSTRFGRYVTAMDMVRAGAYAREYWEDLQRTPLLAIDELGMEPIDPSGWYLANLYDILDHRMLRNRKSILVSNLDLKQFRERYCSGPMERLYDRLKKFGQIEEVEGQSLRRHWQETENDQ